MITSKEIISTIDSIRTICLEKYNEDIQIISSKERDERLGLYKPDEISDFIFYELKNLPVIQIPKLLKTPRLLKMSLRRTVKAWETLHGELDFDDLLILNVLRYGAPEACDFLIDNFREIRGLRTEGIGKDKEDRKKNLQAKWDKMTQMVPWDSTAAEELVAFLFPVWDIKRIGSGKAVLQGARHGEPTDYWIKANIEDLTDVEVRDQEVLPALRGWKRDENDTSFRGMNLPMALYGTNSLAPKIEQFGHLFLDGNDVRNLAKSLFSIILKERGVGANAHSCDSFLSLWRLSLDNPIEQEEHRTWILQEIVKSLKISLRFANDLYYYWKHIDHGSIQEKKPQPELRDPIIKEAKKLYDKNPDKLIGVLDSTFMYCIYHFAIHFSEPDEGGSGFKSEEWRWLALVLIEAAYKKPESVLPQIVTLIVKSHMGRNQYIHELNFERAASLFQDRLLEVLKLLSEDWDYSHFDKHEQERISFAKTAVQEFMKKS